MPPIDLLRRVGLAALLVAASACATTVPLQTASTVPKGSVRLSGQASLGLYCGFSDLDKCAYGASTPELRLAGRVGVHDRVDVGLSGQFLLTSHRWSSATRWGLMADGKVELWRSEVAPGRKQVVSTGLGAAFSVFDDTNAWYRTRDVLELDLVVPVRWGYQFPSVELFVGAHFAERLVFQALAGNAVADVPAGGFSLGIVSRQRAKVGLAVNYEAPLRFFDRGAITLGLGFLYDVGGSYPSSPRRGRVPPQEEGLIFSEETD